MLFCSEVPLVKLLIWVVVIIAALFVTRVLTQKKNNPRPKADRAPAPKGAEQWYVVLTVVFIYHAPRLS